MITKTLRTLALVSVFSLAPFVHAQSAVHSAIVPVPRDANWKVRADLLDERVKETPDTELLFIGDSITQG